nr:MAG TPA: hypothetical protein [Bacteriophage sp.]
MAVGQLPVAVITGPIRYVRAVLFIFFISSLMFGQAFGLALFYS